MTRMLEACQDLTMVSPEEQMLALIQALPTTISMA